MNWRNRIKREPTVEQVAAELTTIGCRIVELGEYVKERERAEHPDAGPNDDLELAGALESALDHLEHVIVSFRSYA